MVLFPGCAVMLALSLSTSDGPTTRPAEVATGFIHKTLTVDGEQYAYCIYVPPGYTPEQTWPVILFLHGSGERGSDGFLQTDVGIGHAIRQRSEWFPAIVVMPQCRPDQTWVGPMGQLALMTVEATSREYNCDPTRVYLTGLSLGGHGAWHIAATLPTSFAAVIVVCGFAEWGDPTGTADKIAAQLTDVPICVFHGSADRAVPVERGREMVAALRARGADVKYTEYEGLGHNVWDKAYGDSGTWKWMFAQRRTPEKPDAE